jgi:exodeoxyribonuclease VII large subunit
MNAIFTVSQVMHDVKSVLETAYADIWVEGELANVNCHSSGHCYATLKDANAQLSFVMFRDDFRRLKFRPEDGLKVIARGRFTLYPPQGRFQMVASHLQPQGKGDLQLAFEQLKAKLQKEGLFDPGRKKPIPAIPHWVGIITSIDGAALHDMLNILERRFANLRILVCPVKVQGEGSARDIAAAIETLNRDYPQLDALLVGRGGGSIEDLWAFNEEVVARAIAASVIPIISCIGHETDVTIADLVADLRAPTPSAAAELVTQAKADLIDRLESSSARLRRFMEYRLQEIEQRLDLSRLVQAIRNLQATRQQELRRLAEKLHLLSPLATLSRGYAIVWSIRQAQAGESQRTVLKNAADVKPDDWLEIAIEQGKVYAQVQRSEA